MGDYIWSSAKVKVLNFYLLHKEMHSYTILMCLMNKTFTCLYKFDFFFFNFNSLSVELDRPGSRKPSQSTMSFYVDEN